MSFERWGRLNTFACSTCNYNDNAIEPKVEFAKYVQVDNKNARRLG